MDVDTRIPVAGTTVGGEYVLGREIGRGAAGVVFEARQTGLERRVAIKMLLPSAMGISGVEERFKREARLASALRHRNSVTVFGFGVHPDNPNEIGLPYIVMEFLEGETLQTYLANRGRLGEDEVVALLVQALGSLQEAHDMGVIHRDLKPENLFVVQTATTITVKVLDYGIAKSVRGSWGSMDARLTATGMMCGTAEYMAPEQATGQTELTAALDVYAIGCLAFHMLVGRPPYTGAGALGIALKHLSEATPRIAREFASEPLSAVIFQAMSKEPDERYQDAAALASALAESQKAPVERFPTAEFPQIEEFAEVRPTLEWHGAAIQQIRERLESGDEFATLPADIRASMPGDITDPAFVPPTHEDDFENKRTLQEFPRLPTPTPGIASQREPAPPTVPVSRDRFQAFMAEDRAASLPPEDDGPSRTVIALVVAIAVLSLLLVGGLTGLVLVLLQG